MQRQAVPLLQPEGPIVGTGMEVRAAQDSGQVLIARHAGVVTSVTAERIQTDAGELDEMLVSSSSGATRAPASTSARSSCRRASPPATRSPLSPPTWSARPRWNVLVAFMSWEGGNYEDERL